MTPPILPDTVRTERLLLRRWKSTDAGLLLPVLLTDFDRLDQWIPRHVAEPVPLDVLARRLANFASDFDADRQWRFCILPPEGQDVYGELSVFPRDGTARTTFARADRVEIGYWLRSDATGRGFATEATRAIVALTAALPRIHRIEIRCDDRNHPSVAIPQRLGFSLEPQPEDSDVESHSMVWFLTIGSSSDAQGQ